ncbi:hypothetical protein KA344_21240, partial [bacterium]|nr:hypothetical protein [bacterium]
SYKVKSDCSGESRVRRLFFTAIIATGFTTIVPARATYANTQPLAPTGPKAPAAKTAVKPTEKPVKNDDLTREIRGYEHKYFERNFESETDDQRLNRLENFIFGTTNSGDAAHRTAQIVAAVGLPAELQAKAAEPTPRPTAGPTTGPAPDQTPGHYPRVTALETAILGQSYQTDAITTRLNRMELKAFGAQSQSSDLSARTDALDQYAEVKLHIKPENALAVNPRMSTPMDGQVPSAAAGNLGTFEANPFVRGLRSIASDLNPVNSIAASSAGSSAASSYSSSSQDDDDPAAEAHRRMIEQQLIDAAKPNAPSSHERTLSRVAWCEMQLFGKSFPQLHLLQRLHQLNADLFPQDKEKDIQLMDRIDIIVREVVLRKHPPA